MVINKLDNTISNNIIISVESLSITNVNFISKTITIAEQPQIFSASTINSKLTISQTPPQMVSVQS
jgi:hypothetical protein